MKADKTNEKKKQYKYTLQRKKKTFFVSLSSEQLGQNQAGETQAHKWCGRFEKNKQTQQGFQTTEPDLHKNTGLMYCQKRRHFMFVNIPPAVVVDVRDDCWFNSNCSVVICTGVVSDINVTACTLLQKVLKTVFLLSFQLFSLTMTFI